MAAGDLAGDCRFVFGGGVWSLHFIAMLGFMPGIAVSYDIGETGWSIVIAVLGAFAGFGVALSRLPVVVRVVCGATLLTASIGGMHYVGVAAMRLQGSFTLGRIVRLIVCPAAPNLLPENRQCFLKAKPVLLFSRHASQENPRQQDQTFFAAF